MRVLKLLVLASIILPLCLAGQDANQAVRLADRSATLVSPRAL